MAHYEDNDYKCPKCGSEAIEWRGHGAGWLCVDCEHEWKGPAPAGANSAFEQEQDDSDGGGDGD